MSTTVSTGTSFIDNVYRAAQVVAIGGTDTIRVSTNVMSLTGINTNTHDQTDFTYGSFSWGKINIGSRNGSEFVFQKNDPLSGLSTSAHIARTTELKAQY